MSERAKAIEAAARETIAEYDRWASGIESVIGRQPKTTFCDSLRAALSLPADPVEAGEAEKQLDSLGNFLLQKTGRQPRKSIAGAAIRYAEELESTITTLRAENERLRAESGKRADDGEAVTEEWLRSSGFKDWDGDDDEAYSHSLYIRMQGELGWECRLAYQSNGFYAFRMCDPGVEEGLVSESVELMGRRNMRPSHTRGDVRRLCSALGITLNERTVSDE